MKYLDLTLTSPETNLALDEALLEHAEAGEATGEVLRLWESPQDSIIVGRSSRLETEVNLAAAHRDSVPVLRRCSGGTAVVLGPGCLVYSLLLSLDQRPQLRNINAAHEQVMDRLCDGLNQLTYHRNQISWTGTCDLVLSDRKFSGNSLRCKRSWILYHGTILYDFDLSKIQRWLGYPPREPEYRQRRSHVDFLTNLRTNRDELKTVIQTAWSAHQHLTDWPADLTHQLLLERYANPDWHRGNRMSSPGKTSETS